MVECKKKATVHSSHAMNIELSLAKKTRNVSDFGVFLYQMTSLNVEIEFMILRVNYPVTISLYYKSPFLSLFGVVLNYSVFYFSKATSWGIVTGYFTLY